MNQQEHNNQRHQDQRQEHEEQCRINDDVEEHLRIIDTRDVLTRDELTELKRLASLSKSTRIVVAALMGVVSLFGVQYVFEWLSKHVH